MAADPNRRHARAGDVSGGGCRCGMRGRVPAAGDSQAQADQGVRRRAIALEAMPTRRVLLAMLLVLGAGCSQLKFLKAPSVPQPRGESSVERGSAFVASSPGRIDTVADWLTYNRTLEGHRGSPLAEIDTT